MKISATFDETQIKAFSLNFDKKLLRHIEKLKSPDKRIKKALLYFAKTGGKRIRPFLLYYMGSFLNIKPSLCLLYTSPSPRDQRGARMPSSA